MAGLGFKKIKTSIDDVFLIERNTFSDERGEFSKTFNYNSFLDLNLDSKYLETVYSISSKNVIRGMHFQKYPYGHTKLIHVIEGEILDVIIGIGGKKNIHNKGKIFSHTLSDKNKLSMYIPDGYAHGFLVLSEKAIVSYLTSTVYNPESDTAINYSSFGFNWPCKKPILSDKDKNAKSFDEL